MIEVQRNNANIKHLRCYRETQNRYMMGTCEY